MTCSIALKAVWSSWLWYSIRFWSWKRKLLARLRNYISDCASKQACHPSRLPSKLAYQARKWFDPTPLRGPSIVSPPQHAYTTYHQATNQSLLRVAFVLKLNFVFVFLFLFLSTLYERTLDHQTASTSAELVGLNQCPSRQPSTMSATIYVCVYI